MTSGRAAPPISPNPSEQHELCFAFGGEGFAPDLNMANFVKIEDQECGFSKAETVVAGLPS